MPPSLLRRRPARLAVTALAAALLAAPAARAADTPARRPNLLLILADDLGFSDLGAFGGEIDTPNLDALAREGLRLTDFHTGATCSPTRSMLLSGTDNHVAGLGSMAELMVDEQKGKPGYEGYLNDRVAPLPALLRDAGYLTLMSGKWHLGLTEERSPKAAGFERSFALLRGADDHVAKPWNTVINPAEPWYREDGKLATVPADFYSTDYYAERMVGYLRDRRGDARPFFGYLTFTAPHWPLQAPDALIARYEARYANGYEPIRQARIAKQKALGLIPAGFEPAKALSLWPAWKALTPAQQRQETRRMATYAAMVDRLDQAIGRVIRELKDSGEYDNTVIVFMSDNGAEGQDPAVRGSQRNNAVENIGRGDSWAAYGPNWAQVSALPFSLFKGFSHEGGTTVPAIVRYPARLGGGKVSAAPGHVTDLAPTLLELAGAKAPAEYRGRPVAPIQGSSLVGFLEGRQPAIHARFEQGWELFGRKAWREGDWKIVWAAPPVGPGEWQLFDLATDRAEQHNVAARQPEVLARLVAGYERYSKSNGVVEVPRLAEKIAERYGIGDYFGRLE
ncbi:arylsulfatase [Derxia gummosa]|uniref:Arylsulfatase n=1 Tax=Derxia gummosa DSM 723 TaxID=1121388 RepID=A0A8B6X966_9BURK|nr:arylsulfatase [Derxia gummosa]